MNNFFKTKYFRFAIAAILYTLVVIWIGSYWLILGLAIVFDIYVTEKVNWSFWKRRDGNNSSFIEWLDALIFAVIAVTLINIFLFQNYRIPTPSMEKSLLVGDHLFVSKVAYGPRMPNTPIAFPFTQHTMPITNGKSWSNIILWPYKRLEGFGEVKRFDPVVFNFPAGDTVVVEEQATAYDEIVRRTARELKDRDTYAGGQAKPAETYMTEARKQIWGGNTIIYRPVDRRDNYVKRCVAVPGDTVFIRQGDLYINGEIAPELPTQQTSYFISTRGTTINPKAFERLSIAKSDQNMISSSVYYLPLTKENVDAITKFTNVSSVTPAIAREREYAPFIFPYDTERGWNEDNFGPLWIPANGVTVKLDSSNIILYSRIIDVYEENDLKVEGNNIYINGTLTDSYTFKMDYYWMMGDNRHNSADSRYWGFVPEDHIVGKPKFIWLSIDKEAKGLKRIRFGRMFKRIK